MGVRRSMIGAVAGLTLMSCTGPGTRPPARTAPTGSEAAALAPEAQRYASIVAPLDAAIDTFTSTSGALPGDSSVDEFVAIARPFVSTIADVDNHLRQVSWPTAARPDIKAELAADDSLATDLAGTADVTLILPVWRRQILAAAAKARRAEHGVQIDLGPVQPPAG